MTYTKAVEYMNARYGDYTNWPEDLYDLYHKIESGYFLPEEDEIEQDSAFEDLMSYEFEYKVKELQGA